MRSKPGTSLADKIEMYSTPEPNTGCWLWIAQIGPGGYGRLHHGKQQLAHRLSYIAHVGPIPDGLSIDHICRVRSCVNPAHLRAVTPKENTHAPGSMAVAAAHAKKTLCREGHEYSITWKGRRRCLQCKSRYDRTRYETRLQATS